MSKTREIACLYYVCEGNCDKDRKAEINGYCQHCDLYTKRAHIKTVNRKKEKLNKAVNYNKEEW